MQNDFFWGGEVNCVLYALPRHFVIRESPVSPGVGGMGSM